MLTGWTDGGTLGQLRRGGELYGGQLWQLKGRIYDAAIQAIRGIAFLHGKDTVHTDVKPDNMLLCRDGTLKLQNVALLAGGGYTPAYAAPEQRHGKRAVPASDLYSWAVSVVELLRGDRPWREGDRYCFP